VILADSSVWIEFLRRSGHPSHRTVAELAPRGRVAVTDPVIMEVLAGIRGSQVDRHRARLLALPFMPVEGLSDFEAAAEIYRQCRAGGETVRSLIDCLIAAVAIREDVELLHNDADFDVIARHTPLRVYAV
jgi:predicted nucleic acid-binding protein